MSDLKLVLCLGSGGPPYSRQHRAKHRQTVTSAILSDAYKTLQDPLYLLTVIHSLFIVYWSMELAWDALTVARQQRFRNHIKQALQAPLQSTNATCFTCSTTHTGVHSSIAYSYCRANSNPHGSHEHALKWCATIGNDISARC